MKKVKVFFLKNLWLTLILLSIVPIVFDIFFHFIQINADLFSVSISLIGFLFTSLTILLSLSNENSYMSLVKKHGKDKELYLMITMCMFFLITIVILCCIKSNAIIQQIISYLFILAMFEILGIIYYVIRISIGYNKYKNSKTD